MYYRKIKDSDFLKPYAQLSKAVTDTTGNLEDEVFSGSLRMVGNVQSKTSTIYTFIPTSSSDDMEAEEEGC